MDPAPAAARPGRWGHLRGPWPDRVLLTLTWLVVAVGAALRIRQWWFPRAFWLDELLLLRAMREQRISGLLSPLGFDQSAPPGWLLVQHVLLGEVGSGERGARLLPLAFGIAAVAVTAVLARTVLGGPAALVATALVAVSTPLIRYSAEVKQYSADAFWVPLLVLAGFRVAQRRGDPRWDRLLLAAAAAVTVWFSHAGALAAGGVFLAVGLLALAGRRWRELLLLVACSVPYAAGLCLEYATLLAANADNAVLKDFWRAAFPPEGPLTWSVGWDWFVTRTQAVTANPVGWPRTRGVLVLALAGLAVLGARRPRALLVLVLPVAAVVAAGLVGSYPIANRLALWLVPLAALAVAAVLDLPAVLARLPRTVRLPAALTPPAAARSATGGRVVLPARVPALAVGAVAVLLAAGQLAALTAPPIRKAAAEAATPREQEEARTVLAAVAAQRRPGDLVLVDGGGARQAAAYYGPRVGLGDYALLMRKLPSSPCPRTWYGDVLRDTSAAPRVWFVSSHLTAGAVAQYTQHLSRFGPRTWELTETGAVAYRWDRGPVPAVPDDPGPQRCLQAVDPSGVR